jgi:hypothetical protein
MASVLIKDWLATRSEWGCDPHSTYAYAVLVVGIVLWFPCKFREGACYCHGWVGQRHKSKLRTTSSDMQCDVFDALKLVTTTLDSPIKHGPSWTVLIMKSLRGSFGTSIFYGFMLIILLLPSLKSPLISKSIFGRARFDPTFPYFFSIVVHFPQYPIYYPIQFTAIVILLRFNMIRWR